MIRVRLIDKPFAKTRDGNQARFASLNEVREMGKAALLLGHQGDWGECSGMPQVARHLGAQGFSHSETVARVAPRRSGEMRLACGIMGQELAFSQGVMRKATSCQNNTVLGIDANRFFLKLSLLGLCRTDPNPDDL